MVMEKELEIKTEKGDRDDKYREIDETKRDRDKTKNIKVCL